MAGIDFGVNLAAGVAKDCLWGVVREARYCKEFNTLVTELGNEKDNLVATRGSMEVQVRRANANTEETLPAIQNLMGEATNLKEKVEKLQRRAEASKSCCNGVCPNWLCRYIVGKKAVKMTEEVRGLNIRLVSSQPFIASRLSLRRITHGIGGTSENFIFFECTVKAHDELLMALKDPEMISIGLYGMGGCGKTSLINQVLKTVEDLNLFNKVVYVVVSNNPNIRTIQGSIASWLGLRFETEENEPERAARLSMRLNQNNEAKYLIILDDVWEVLRFEDIGIPLGENCKVLICTRKQDICPLKGFKKVVHLQLLRKEEAWQLFQKYAGEIDDTLQDLAQKISNECHSLPVAIKAVASALNGKPEVMWENAWNLLRTCAPPDFVEGQENPYKCLKLSFDQLEDEEVKSLSLLCAFFPEDSEIFQEDLIRFSFGLGIFRDADMYEIARSRVGAAINKLTGNCLLLQEGRQHVKMHDLVRDVALWIANKKTQVIVGPRQNLRAWMEKDNVKDTTRLYCLNIDELPDELKCPELEVLLVSNNGGYTSNFPDAFFKETVQLKVLAILDTSIWRNPNLLLPQSIEWLKKLATLCLRGWTLENISILRKLERLDTVELLYCVMKELPKELAELRRLKLLEVSGCRILGGNPYEVLAICLQQGMEELYFIGNNHVLEMDSNDQNVAKLLHQVAYSNVLQRYHLEIGSSIDALMDDSSTKFISINNFNVSMANEAIKEVAQKLEVLFLAKIQGDCKNIIPDMVPIEEGGCMNKLTEFLLCDSDDIEFLIDTTKHEQQFQVGRVFSMLLKLKIEGMDFLEALCRGPPPCGLLENLEELFIMECSKMQCIVSEGRLNLRSLRFLELEDCPKLLSLFMLSTAQTMIMLQVLKVRDCSKLEHIIQDDEEDGLISTKHVFPNLKQVIVKGCEHLECIIPASLAGGLSQLERLQIEDAQELKHVFGNDNNSAPPHRKRNQFHSIHLARLQAITFTNLPNIVSICSQNYQVTLPALKELATEGCPLWSEATDLSPNMREEACVKSEEKLNTEIESSSHIKEDTGKDCGQKPQFWQQYFCCGGGHNPHQATRTTPPIVMQPGITVEAEHLNLMTCADRGKARCNLYLNRFLEGFVTEKKKLLSTKERMKVHATEYIRRALPIDTSTEIWLKDVDVLVQQVEKLEETAIINQSCCLENCHCWTLQRHLAKEMEKKTREITDHIENSKLIHFSNDFVLFECAKSAYDKLLESLTGDDEASVIGMHGIAGCGKTTLARQVSKAVQVKQYFDAVIFVDVSFSANVSMIQGRIAEDLKLELWENDESKRAECLFSRLAGEERILIILDNVREELNYEKIGIPCEQNHVGCNVLLTTRIPDVCNLNKCQKVIPLQLLTEEEACNMFLMYAGISGGILDTSKSDIAPDTSKADLAPDTSKSDIAPDTSKADLAPNTSKADIAPDTSKADLAPDTSKPDIAPDTSKSDIAPDTSKPDLAPDTSKADLAPNILRECGGLGIAIKIVASSLKGKTIERWRESLEKLRHSGPVDIENGLSVIYRAVKFSYDSLEDEKLKSLFLLYSIYGEAYEVFEGPLSSLAIGVGLFEEVQSLKMRREQVTVATKKLIDRCLLLKIKDEESVSMNNSVREIALQIAKDGNKMIVGPEISGEALQQCMTEESNKVSYLCLEEVSSFPYEMEFSKLEALLLMGKSAEDICFNRMKELRFMFLRNYKRCLSLKQCESLKSLTNLHCLELTDCKFSDISFLESLTKLEMLTMNCCSFPSLPSGITNLEKLRLLEVLLCEIEMNPYEVISRCSHLEELCVYGNHGSKWTDHVENVSEIPGLNSTTPALQRYHIGIGSISTSFCKTPRSRSSNLSVQHFDASTTNETVKNLVKRAEVLHLDAIQGGCKNIIPTMVENMGGCMSESSKIVLRHCDGIECLVDTTFENHNVFPKLESLHLKHMKALKTLFRTVPSPNTQNCLHNLKVLKLEACSVLTVFPPAIAQSLKLLEQVKVKDCNRLKCIMTYEEGLGKKTTATKFVFPKLKKLCVFDCHSLEYIAPVCYAEGLVQLETLIIESSSQLQHVFGHPKQDLSQKELSLPALKELRLCWLQQINGICPKNCYAKWPSLQRIKLLECRNLSITSVNNPIVSPAFSKSKGLELASSSRPKMVVENVEDIDVASCGIISIFQSTEHTTKSSCQRLVLMDLHLLRSICESHIQLDTLQSVRISRCHQLKCIFSPSMARNLCQLTDLDFSNCELLEEVFLDEDDIVPKFTSTIPPEKVPSVPFNLCNILRVTVRNCPRLRSLFNGSTAKSLTSLYCLKIENCFRLEYVVKDAEVERNKGKEIVVEDDAKATIPKLRIVCLENLPNLVHVHRGFKLQCERRRVLNCPKLKGKSVATSETGVEGETSGSKEAAGETSSSNEAEGVMAVAEEEEEKHDHDVDEDQEEEHVTTEESNITMQRTTRRETHKALDGNPSIVNDENQKNEENQMNNKGIGNGFISLNNETEAHETVVENLSATLSGTGEVAAIEQHDHLSKENRRNITDIPTGVNLNKATAAVVDQPTQEFDAIVDTQEGPKEQKNNHVGSINLRESNTEKANGSVLKDPTFQESEVATSPRELVERSPHVELELPQAGKHLQLTHKEYKVDFPLAMNPTMLSPSSSSIIVSPATKAVTSSSSIEQHSFAEELVDFHGLFKINAGRACMLDEAFAKYPHLWEWKASQKTPRLCKWGYKSLADMLVFLKSETPNTMNRSKMNTFEDLCSELESFGFDKEWLGSIRRRVMAMQVDHNDKLNHLAKLKSRVSTLKEELNITKARMTSMKDDLCKLDVFGL